MDTRENEDGAEHNSKNGNGDENVAKEPEYAVNGNDVGSKPSFMSKERQLMGPAVKCKEKIVFFIDISSDMNSISLNQGRSRSQTFLSYIQKTLKMFMNTKSTLNTEHEYALVLMQGNVTTWLHEFSNDYRGICQMIDELETADESENANEIYDFGQVIQMLKRHCYVPEVGMIALPPPYILRVVFIYGRSQTELTITEDDFKELENLKESPYFFLDILYLHEAPSPENKAKDIYDFFCNLDKEEKGYILEVSNNAKILFETVAKLISHPLQRCSQNEAFYDLMPGPMED